MDPAAVCYRHPERPTGVGCQRCDRPICPECMVPASIGYQCPECVRARPQRVVPAAAVFAAPDARVTKTLVLLNGGVFLASALTGGLTGVGGGLTRVGALFGPAVATGDWYRLLSSGFLHGGVFHLLSNMMLLWLLGSSMEAAFGRVPYAFVYLAGLLGGSLGALVVTPLAVTVGASGAVFGLMAAFAVAQFRAGHSPWNTGMGGLIAVNLAFTFLVPGISVGGHVGGLLAGAAAGWLLAPAQRTPGAGNDPVRLAVVGALCVALAIGGVVAARRSTVAALLPGELGAAASVHPLSLDEPLEVAQVALPDAAQHGAGHG